MDQDLVKEEDESKSLSGIAPEDIEELKKEEEEEEINLDNLESLKVDRKVNVYQNDQSYNFQENKERVDVFVKNYLMKFNMERSLKQFEQEFYERLSKGEIKLEDIGTVPEVYIKSEKIQKAIGNFQKDLDAAKIYREKANSKFMRLRRAKENAKINHRRVQQEKQLLIKEIDKMKLIYQQDNQLYKELSKKYSDVTVKTALFDAQIGSMRQKIENLDEQLERLRKSLEDARGRKNDAENIKEDKEIRKEELKGNKIVSWTPYPKNQQSRENFLSFSPPSTRMNVVKSFPGHLSGITSLSFNPKKIIIATGSDDKTWKLWKFPTGELLMHGEGHSDWISCVSFHPNGVVLGTCGGDGNIKLWNIIQEKCVHSIIDHADPVWKIKFHPEGNFMLSSSMDHSIRLFDLHNYRTRNSYRAHVDSVNSINWVPFSNMFVSGSADKTVSLWDMRSNICAQTFYGHTNAVNACAVSQSGTVLGSCDADGIVKFWDVRTLSTLCSFDESKASANCLSFDGSGEVCAVGFDDGGIRLFRSAQKFETSLKGHEDAVLDVVYDPNNQMLISAGNDRTFKIWQ